MDKYRLPTFFIINSWCIQLLSRLKQWPSFKIFNRFVDPIWISGKASICSNTAPIVSFGRQSNDRESVLLEMKSLNSLICQKFTRNLRFASNVTMNWLHRLAFLTITWAIMTRFWNNQLPHNLEFILLLECHSFGPLRTHIDDQNRTRSQKGRKIATKSCRFP